AYPEGCRECSCRCCSSGNRAQTRGDCTQADSESDARSGWSEAYGGRARSEGCRGSQSAWTRAHESGAGEGCDRGAKRGAAIGTGVQPGAECSGICILSAEGLSDCAKRFGRSHPAESELCQRIAQSRRRQKSGGGYGRQRGG